MEEATRTRLVDAACEARLLAHAPYSGFQVGAALLTVDGVVFRGCNVENASFGLTVCAERVAVFAAASHGHRNYRAIAVASPKASFPCGACLQVMAEFCDDLLVWLIDPLDPESLRETRLTELLPSRFPPPGELTESKLL